MIDIHTLMLALGVGNIGFAVLMAGYTHGTTPNPGLRLWITSRLVLGGTQLLGWLPVPWLAGIDAIGSVTGVALEVTAYAVFFGFERWKRVLAAVGIMSLLLMLAARVQGVSYVGQMALTCAFISLYGMLTTYILLRPRMRGSSLLQRIIGTNNAVFALAMAMGAWDGLMHPERAIGTSPWHSLAGVGAYLLMIVNGFGFLLLCKQKDDERLALLATTDCLTGLVNRRAFFEQAEAARLFALRLRKPLALVMLDIDHFKQINDRHGHAVGDDALRVFAATARGTLREHDIMGRLGGEEFAIALPGTDLDGALQAAERLRAAVTAMPLATSEGEHTMTVSAGVAVLDPNEPLTAALARADHALYAAKAGGRNRVEVGQAVLRMA